MRAPTKASKFPKRRMGLTKVDLGYSLHPNIQLNAKEQKSPKPEPAVDAPPVDSSDESILSNADVSPPRALSEDELPTTDKAKREGYRVQILPMKVLDDSDTENGHIKPTTFTSSGRDGRGARYVLDKKRTMEGIPEDDDVMILSQSSQNKRSKTYKSKNLHGSDPPARQKKAHKQPGNVVTTGTNGFKAINTDTITTPFNKSSSTKAKKTFKEPPKLSFEVTSPVRGTRRSVRIHCAGDTPKDTFQLPPTIPPRLTKLSKPETKSSFVAPPFLINGQASEVVGSFKMPAHRQEMTCDVDLTDIPSSKETSNHYSISSVSSISSLSSPPSSPILAASAIDIDLSTFSSMTPPPSAQSTLTLCPFCQDPISASALLAFTAERKTSHRLTVRQQAHFCRIHKTESARETWKIRGYPNINWSAIPARIERHHDFIISLMQDMRPSFYRTLLMQKVASGKSRTAVQALMDDGVDVAAEMGYYGSKGASIMMEHIVSKYSKEIRQLAGADKVVAAAGEVSGFAQSVLVPELVCRFVMEDMNLITEEEGRRVCAESADLGFFLCEAEDDQRLPCGGEEMLEVRVEDAREQEDEKAYGE
ncbi:hypothetical protein MMC13_006197 [Lambiella insularis]|nr:hypothetical protein [Lambiella insularis]